MRAKTKARIKTILILLGIALAVALMIYAGMQSVMRHVKSDVYTDGVQTVTLFDDGSFTADLRLNMQRSGTYEKVIIENVSVITIWFFVAGERDIGWLMNDVLQLPPAWEIDENETFLPKR
jgi:ABC-type antimicrobial peptide transport system permease subunit